MRLLMRPLALAQHVAAWWHPRDGRSVEAAIAVRGTEVGPALGEISPALPGGAYMCAPPSDLSALL